MEIQSINSNININNTQAKAGSVQSNEFKELFDKITGGDMAQEIRDTYDVTLNVGSIGNVTDFLNTHDIKSAGMIVYPDGDTLYWLEGYPNDFGDMKEKKVIASEVDMANAQRIYSSSIDGNVMENDIETAMQILGTTYMRKDM